MPDGLAAFHETARERDRDDGESAVCDHCFEARLSAD